MVQALPYDGYEYVIISLDEILATADDCEIVSSVDVGLECTDTIKN